jgi:sterol O-acyltransferase
MSSSSTGAMANGHAVHQQNGDHDHVLRPRPRKPQHSQLSNVSNLSDTDFASVGALHVPENGTVSGLTR